MMNRSQCVIHSLCHSTQFVLEKCDIHIIYVITLLCVSQLVPFNNILWGCVAHCDVCMFTHRFHPGVYGMCVPVCLLFSFSPLVCNSHLATCLEATMRHHQGKSKEGGKCIYREGKRKTNLRMENEKKIPLGQPAFCCILLSLLSMYAVLMHIFLCLFIYLFI